MKSVKSVGDTCDRPPIAGAGCPAQTAEDGIR